MPPEANGPVAWRVVCLMAADRMVVFTQVVPVLRLIIIRNWGLVSACLPDDSTDILKAGHAKGTTPSEKYVRSILVGSLHESVLMRIELSFWRLESTSMAIFRTSSAALVLENFPIVEPKNIAQCGRFFTSRSRHCGMRHRQICINR